MPFSNVCRVFLKNLILQRLNWTLNLLNLTVKRWSGNVPNISSKVSSPTKLQHRTSSCVKRQVLLLEQEEYTRTCIHHKGWLRSWYFVDVMFIFSSFFWRFFHHVVIFFFKLWVLKIPCLCCYMSMSNISKSSLWINNLHLWAMFRWLTFLKNFRTRNDNSSPTYFI